LSGFSGFFPLQTLSNDINHSPAPFIVVASQSTALFQASPIMSLGWWFLGIPSAMQASIALAFFLPFFSFPFVGGLVADLVFRRYCASPFYMFWNRLGFSQSHG